MTLDKLSGVPAIGRYGQKTDPHYKRKQGGSSAHHHGGREEPTDWVDVTSVMGIPPAELTPAVEKAIVTLMAELDDLREELKRLKEYENYLSEVADSHPYLPVLNRRALIGELHMALNQLQRSNIGSTLVWMVVENYEEVRDNLGLHAAETLLRGVAETLNGNLRQIDRVAALDGGEFALLMKLADDEDVLVKLDHINSSFEIKPIVWETNFLEVKIDWGIHRLLIDDTPETAIEAADQARSHK